MTPQSAHIGTGHIRRNYPDMARPQTSTAETQVLHSMEETGTAAPVATGTCLHGSLKRRLDCSPCPCPMHQDHSTVAQSTHCSRHSRYNCSASAGSCQEGCLGRQCDLRCTRGLCAQNRTQTRPAALEALQHLVPPYSTCHFCHPSRIHRHFGMTLAWWQLVPER